MRDLLRESFLGRLLHLTTGGRLCKTAEQLDPSLLDVYREGALTRRASSERTLALADREGRSVRRSNSEKSAKLGTDGSAIPSATANAEAEKGRDYQLVTWTENDPEVRLPSPQSPSLFVDSVKNPRNWSTLKKFFVTFQICFLTFSVYIGSAIYTPGLFGVMMDFNVSQTVALLGLTLFILGYALGPMVLVCIQILEYQKVCSELTLAGSNVRDALLWADAHLHHHSCHLCLLATAHHLRQKHWHCSSLSVPHGSIWESRLGDWWRQHCRHVRAQEASIWYRGMGFIGRLWPYYGPTDWWLRCASQRLDMDDLGTLVAFGLRARDARLPASRDIIEQHSLPANRPVQKAHGQ